MKILVYPKDSNPYQDLLYSTISPEIEVQYLVNAFSSHVLSLLALPLQLIIFRIKGFNVLHIHWVFMFQLTNQGMIFNNYITRLIFSVYFLFFLIITKFLHYKIVWTVHDVLPHKKVFLNDRLMSIILSYFSNLKIVHTSNTVQIMEKLSLRTNDTVVIPIGSYFSVYPNYVTKSEARKFLNIDENSIVFGFFGRIEKYKGIYELVLAYQKIQGGKSKLLIAGKCYDEEIESFLHSEAKKDKNILLFLNYIPDNEVQYFMNATDIFVYPFRKVNTSSSIILNMSFSKPTIANLTGDIIDYPKDSGIYIDKKSDTLLYEMMNAVMNNKYDLNELGTKAKIFTEHNSWKASGIKTISAYCKMFD